MLYIVSVLFMCRLSTQIRIEIGQNRDTSPTQPSWGAIFEPIGFILEWRQMSVSQHHITWHGFCSQSHDKSTIWKCIGENGTSPRTARNKTPIFIFISFYHRSITDSLCSSAQICSYINLLRWWCQLVKKHNTYQWPEWIGPGPGKRSKKKNTTNCNRKVRWNEMKDFAPLE